MIKEYISIPKKVTALRWNGKYSTIKEIPNETFIHPPEFDRIRQTLMLNVIEGGLMSVEKGDYIIIRDDGRLEIQNKEEFKITYKEI